MNWLTIIEWVLIISVLLLNVSLITGFIWEYIRDKIVENKENSYERTTN